MTECHEACDDSGFIPTKECDRREPDENWLALDKRLLFPAITEFVAVYFTSLSADILATYRFVGRQRGIASTGHTQDGRVMRDPA